MWSKPLLCTFCTKNAVVHSLTAWSKKDRRTINTDQHSTDANAEARYLTTMHQPTIADGY